MSATTIIAQAFGEGANLYTTVLGLEITTTNPSSSSSSSLDTSTITQSQLRKAYYKRALLYHPDKQSNSNNNNNNDAEQTKLKFQAVSVAYTILSDPTKRTEYDTHGELDDIDDDSPTSSSGTNAWTDYFRSVFGSVTPDDIDAFTLSYKCSDAERIDVLRNYTKFKGDLNRVVECVMCAEEGVVDKRRWVEDYIKPAVADGSVEGGGLMEMVERTMEDDDDVEGGGEEEEEEDEDVMDVGDLDEDGLDDEDEDDDDDFVEEEEEEEDEDNDDEEDTETDLDSVKDENPPPTDPTTTNTTKRKSQPQSQQNRKLPKASSKRKATPAAAVSDDLIAAIRGNRSKVGSGFGSMLAGLEERYGSSSSSSKKKSGKSKSKKSSSAPPPQEEIPDEEFDRIRARLDSERRKKKRKGGAGK